MTGFQYYVASSMDGLIADPDGDLDWLLRFDGFEGQQASYAEFLSSVGAIVMGADTYRFLLAQDVDAWPYERIPAWVFTHQELPGYPEADITFVRGDIREFVSDIRSDAGERNVWVMGGGDLAGQFLAAGYLDELILTVVPVLLGDGTPLIATPAPGGSSASNSSAGKSSVGRSTVTKARGGLPGDMASPTGTTTPAELLGTRAFDGGIVELHYRLGAATAP